MLITDFQKLLLLTSWAPVSNFPVLYNFIKGYPIFKKNVKGAGK